MPTPAIVQRIIAAFKQRKDDLFLKAVASEEMNNLVDVSFEAEDMLVTAKFNRADALFVQLVAVPMIEPPHDEPAVVYEITPPESEPW
ncbi:MAG: hypothetical protein KA175_08325 [Flavobacteriales bacterium]|nr:hypothetical protein [Flavobacteriales bacterium]